MDHVRLLALYPFRVRWNGLLAESSRTLPKKLGSLTAVNTNKSVSCPGIAEVYSASTVFELSGKAHYCSTIASGRFIPLYPSRTAAKLSQHARASFAPRSDIYVVFVGAAPAVLAKGKVPTPRKERFARRDWKFDDRTIS